MLVSSEITRHEDSIIACSHLVYMGAVLCAHPVRGESHIQRNTNGEVATVLSHIHTEETTLKCNEIMCHDECG